MRRRTLLMLAGGFSPLVGASSPQLWAKVTLANPDAHWAEQAITNPIEARLLSQHGSRLQRLRSLTTNGRVTWLLTLDRPAQGADADSLKSDVGRWLMELGVAFSSLEVGVGVPDHPGPWHLPAESTPSPR